MSIGYDQYFLMRMGGMANSIKINTFKNQEKTYVKYKSITIIDGKNANII